MVIEPPPVLLTVPLITRSVLLPTDFIARVPLLVSVPWSVVVELSWAVTVLPVVMVTPLSVLLPLNIAPPLAVVSGPPLIVAPLRFTTEFVPVERMVPAPVLLIVVGRFRVPPAVASSVPLLPTATVGLIVMPAVPLELIVPLLVKVRLVPTPIWPEPWIVLLVSLTSVPLLVV
jgi:hypothetical protein